MRQALLDPNMSDEDKFKVWRQGMSKSLSDDEVRELMKVAHDNLVKFNLPKPKVKKLKEFMERVRPLLPTLSEEKRQMLSRILEAANAAQQAAIAINMKKKGKKPKKKTDESIDYLPEK